MSKSAQLSISNNERFVLTGCRKAHVGLRQLPATQYQQSLGLSLAISLWRYSHSIPWNKNPYHKTRFLDTILEIMRQDTHKHNYTCQENPESGTMTITNAQLTKTPKITKTGMA